ncbi:uncharacterized protein LOC124451255 [Xenia sp. Carnegie-2017]|uniref:uncharacterized protein LOC124451255 n=1 Tax=Xenia sp. Carnegie-2017 TaxID=2897299 RepID=UPI001F0392BA|nr:uncharacterized protein LOC124451255 [Xenia sp. Carnegie-2017]
MASPPQNLKFEANGSRLSKLLINKGKQALTHTLQSLLKPSSLAGKLKDPSTKKKLTSLKFKVIKNEQWDLLYPSIDDPDIEKFDITLLTVLLRNICGLKAPTTGWDKLPSSSDTSVSANIARIKFYRNKVYGHITTTSVNDNELKKAPLTTDETNYIEMLKEWYKKEEQFLDVTEKIKEDVKVIKRNVVGIKQEMAIKVTNLNEDVKKTKADVEGVKKMLQNKKYSDVEKLGKCNFNPLIKDLNKKYLQGTRQCRPELPVQKELKDMNPMEITTRPRDKNNEKDLHNYLRHKLNNRLQGYRYVLWDLVEKCEGLSDDMKFKDRIKIQEVLSQFFPIYDDYLTVYHKSLIDWLKSDGYEEHEFTVDPRNGHKFLWHACEKVFEQIKSMNIFEDQMNTAMIKYALKNRIYHMSRCGENVDFSFAVEDNDMYTTRSELPLEEWKYIDQSTKHRDLFIKLIEYGRNPSVEVKVMGNVRVILSEEFCIGEGSDATRVFLGLSKDGYGKAVKQIHRHKFIQLAHHEKKILNEFNAKKSKYLVNYFYLEEDTGTDYIYLILDLCEESLESFVKSSTLHDLQKALPNILRQILKGLADLHSGPNCILHRDLKPSNVLRDSKCQFLIADFGISRIMKNDTTTYKSNTSMGTLHWIAPESYCEDDDSVNKARYNRRSDVYNAGMVAYYVATKGKHPFGTKPHRLINMLNGNPVDLKEIKDETLKDLLRWMLNLKPEDRPYSNEALKHPFLMSDNEKFEMLSKVGNLRQIKTNDLQSSVVQKLNSESVDLEGQLGSDVYEYFVNGRPYKSSWTECLRLIRNIDQHWNDPPLPQPELFYNIGDYKAYFLQTFPNLPVRVHAAVRSNKELKNKPELKNIFNFDESELHQ